MPILDHFDFLAPFYDRVISPPEDSPLFGLLEPPAAGWLLDAAGGTGRVAAMLGGGFDQIAIVDRSLPMLGRALAKGCCTPVAGETEVLPFRDGAFTRVIIIDAYHHLAEQHASLSELWRVLAAGGRLVIEEPDIAHFGVKLVALAERLTLMRSRFVRAENIAEGLKALGAQTRILRQEHNFWVVGQKS